MLRGWRVCASVTHGGKPYFYTRDKPSARIMWDRDILAYELQINNRFIGHFPTVDAAMNTYESNH